jgi:hypothetical protein
MPQSTSPDMRRSRGLVKLISKAGLDESTPDGLSTTGARIHCS